MRCDFQVYPNFNQKVSALKIPNFLYRFAFSLICLSLTSSPPVFASDQYADGFTKYLNDKRLHKAFAISGSASWYWVNGRRSRKDAEQEALSRCNRGQTAVSRAQNCRVVHIDNEFVVPNGHRMMTIRMAAPVDIEIYDGKKSVSQKIKGLFLPDIRHGQTAEKRTKINLMTLRGNKICDGRYSSRNRGKSYSFDLICFGKFKFKGVATTLGRQKTGFFWTPIFDFKLKTGNSYIHLRSVK